MIETMDSVNVQLIWILFVTDVFRSTGPVVNASDVCGQIEIVRPPIAGRNVTLKFFPIQRNQHGTVEWKRRNGNTSWRNLNGNSRFLQHEENGVYYLIITRASSSTDKANYMAYYKSGDTIACSSDAVSLTLIGLENCGYIYLRSTKIIINETVEIGYYPTLSIFKNPDRYVRHWFHSDDCIKGCTTDQPNSKFEAQLYPNHEYVLKIHHFKTTDEGEYKLQCTTGRENNVFTDPVNIVLPVPPSTPVLTPLETIDGCTNCIVGKDDTELEVLCSSIEGTRPLDVTIKVADTRLKVELDESNGEYRARLRLNDTVLHMTKLVCSVDNQATAVPLTAEAYIYIIKASNTTSLHIPSRLIEGDPVNITCIKRNIRPAASNITMLIDGNMVDGLELRHQLDNVTLLYNSWATLTTTPRYCNKKNVTCCEYFEAIHTDICSSPEPVDFVCAKSWLEGFNACNRAQVVSGGVYVYKVPENKTNIAELVAIHGPLWTYGLEVIFHQNGKTKAFQINRRNPSLPAMEVCSQTDQKHVFSIVPNRRYTEAKTACRERNSNIPIVTPTNITLYASDILVHSSFWVAFINEESYLNISDSGIDVRCLLYDSNGDIKTDDCNSKHKTLCVTEFAMPVVKYVANVTLPRLRKESPKALDSKEAGPNKGAIIGGVIGGIACVGLIILAVFCLCCRHRNTKDKKEGNIELQDKKDTESKVKDDGSAYYNISKPAKYECLGAGTGASEYTSLSQPELDAVQSDEPARYECLGEGTGASEYTSLSQPELDAVQSDEPARYECLDGRNSSSQYTSLSRP